MTQKTKLILIFCTVLSILTLMTSCVQSREKTSARTSDSPVTSMTQTTEPTIDGTTEPSGTQKTIRPNRVHPIEAEHVILNEDAYGGYVNNILIVFVKEGVTEKEILSWFPGENASIAGQFPGLNQFQVRIKARKRLELEKLADQLMSKEQVLYAHLDLADSIAAQDPNSENSHGTDEPSEEPVPPSFAEQKKPVDEWWYHVIGLHEAQKYLPDSNLVKVAVVDDGFDTSHPDLKLVFPNQEQANLNSPEEHGTHVAGIVQQILPGSPVTVTDSYRIPGLDPDGHLVTQCQFMKYLVDLVESEVKVINYSMGTDITDDQDMPWTVDFSTIASVYIHQLKQKGHDFLIVQSAGNVGIDASRNGVFCTINAENCLGSSRVRESLGVGNHVKDAQKSVFDSIVVVGSSDKKDASGVYRLSDGTNYGELITIMAPGVEINSTVPGGYSLMSGTSQAAPIVSGSLGLLWSLRPGMTSGELKQLLIDSATENVLAYATNQAVNQRQTYPLLNLFEAAKRIKSGK